MQKTLTNYNSNSYIHPKLLKLKEILLDHFKTMERKGCDTRVIIFTQFRSSVQEIYNYLSNIDYVKPTPFVGQSRKVKNKSTISMTDGISSILSLYGRRWRR